MVDDNTVMLYRGGLSWVGNNVLDRISVLEVGPQPVSPVPVAVVSSSPAPSSIRGTIQDQSKAMIPRVTVTSTSIDTGAKLTTTTNDVGVYRFSGRPHCKCTMTASLSGCNPTTISTLTIGDSEVLQDLTLEFPTPLASAIPTAASRSGNDIAWCALLHRTK